MDVVGKQAIDNAPTCLLYAVWIANGIAQSDSSGFQIANLVGIE